MEEDSATLTRQLRQAGISLAAIRAAWPSWWSEEVEHSPSGRAELRFALARRLGLHPKPLLGERVEFVWNDEAKFKHLGAEGNTQKAALTSFGISVARLLVRATKAGPGLPGTAPGTLRSAILKHSEFVDLKALISTCWSVGIPVIYLRVFPLEAKAMHAMVVEIDGRAAILLGRDASHPAPVAFTLAHELAHAILGHLGDAPALVDLQDPALARDGDEQEGEADAYALELLTGSPEPDIRIEADRFNAPGLADAVLRAGPEHRIEPGTLALCVGHVRRAWPVAMAALNFVYRERRPVWRDVNGIADLELDWDALNDESGHYLRNVMIGADD